MNTMTDHEIECFKCGELPVFEEDDEANSCTIEFKVDSSQIDSSRPQCSNVVRCGYMDWSVKIINNHQHKVCPQHNVNIQTVPMLEFVLEWSPTCLPADSLESHKWDMRKVKEAKR